MTRAALWSLPCLLALGCPTPSVSMSDSDAGSGGTTVGDEAGSGSTGPGGADESSTGMPPPLCGNGIVEGDEECDEGDANAFDGDCIVDCTVAYCGDGFVHVDEECDDGNDEDFDACTTDCIDLALCGDGRLDDGEECDDAADNDEHGSCLPDCSMAVCGDGYIYWGVEECDDENSENDDECTTLCLYPTCGDGFTSSLLDEACDDGDAMEGDACNSDCASWGQWTHEFNSMSDLNDAVYDVAFDSTGAVVAVGSSFDAAQLDDVWVRKLAADGAVTWTQTYDGITVDIGRAVAIGPGDAIFVAGTTLPPAAPGNGRDVWLRRYTSGGAAGFTATANGTADADDEALGVAVDSAGNVIITGFVTSSTSGRNIWTRKYSAAGATLWTRTATSAGGENDEGHGVATDGTDVIVVGHVWDGAGQRDIWIRRYDAAGTEQWTQTHAGPAGMNDEANDVVVDSTGDIVVVGYVTTAGRGTDIWIGKYDAAGTELWTRTHDGPASDTDRGNAVAIDAGDGILVAGLVLHATQSSNVFLGRWDPSGGLQWTSTHDSASSLSDVAHGVDVDAAGNVVVGGFETRSNIGEARNVWVRYVLP